MSIYSKLPKRYWPQARRRREQFHGRAIIEAAKRAKQPAWKRIQYALLYRGDLFAMTRRNRA